MAALVACPMIQYLLLQNRQGKTRLSKYYRPYTDEEKSKLEGEIHRLVTTRDPKFTNFVEVRPSDSQAPRARHGACTAANAPPFPLHIAAVPCSSVSTSSSTGGMRGSSSRYVW